MTPIDGSDMILLMLAGVAVVLITVRLMVRAHRNEQEALKQQSLPPPAPAMDHPEVSKETSPSPHRSR